MKKFPLTIYLLLAAISVEAKDYQLISTAEISFVFAKVFGVIKNRWVVIEAANFIRTSEGGSHPYGQVMYSIDCANRGIEVISKMVNLKTGLADKPVWIEIAGSKYKNGFTPEKIAHTPVHDFIKKEHENIINSIEDENAKKLLEEEPFAPDYEEVIVEFGCLVARGGVSDKVAAETVEATGGVSDVKSLTCSLVPEMDKNAKPLNISVRFSELRNFVQAQGIWLKNRSINKDRIWFNLNGNNFSLDRQSGLIGGNLGGVRMSGSCSVDDGKRKF